MHTAGAATQIHLARHPEEAISAEQAELVNETVMAQCDTLGEGFLNDPLQCSVDFSSLTCTEGAERTCLNDAQMRSVERYYGGLENSAGEVIFAGQAYGNPIRAMASRDEAPNPFAFDTIRILGFQDADYDWRDFDLDRDMPRIDKAAGFVDAVDPDLRAFEANGGKLLLYHGWGDAGITPLNTIEYYESVRAEMGPEQGDWLRLFMVPGMGHCGGGPGPNTFDTISALEQWREEGEAPDMIMGRNPQSGLERPLCPFPEAARYDGSGDVAAASNWTCAAD
jgi:feruloyl esterase